MSGQPAIPKDRVRATRYVPTKTICVASRTIGTDLTYNLFAQNLSRTGLLLAWNQARPIPFIENTIIEMTIDPRKEWLQKPVSCLGKIVRRAGQKVLEPSLLKDLEFGVSIVQIDNADMDIWEACLSELAASGAQIVAFNPDGLESEDETGSVIIPLKLVG